MIPLPTPTAISAPHWEGCQQGELLVQRCNDCGAYVFIPQFACTQCMSENLVWVKSSGNGTIYSFTTVYRPQRPEFDVPYTVAIVELEEGWYMLSNVVECDPEEISVGMPVQVMFRKMSDAISLPLFRPIR